MEALITDKPKLKLGEIADRISAHLKRFEADPEINKKDRQELSPYWNANAWDSRPRVFIRYVSYQGHSSLTKEQAVRYLKMLDEGFVGRHYRALDAIADEKRGEK